MFYPGDWMKDPALRSCSVAARGLWIDMLCLMFESDRRGYLQHVTGKPVTAEQLARMTGCSTDDVSQLLQELEDCGVFSRTEHGVIYSRRLIGDERKRKLCSEAGKKGGNPTLKGESKGHDKGEVKGAPNLNPTPSFAVSNSVSDSKPKDVAAPVQKTGTAALTDEEFFKQLKSSPAYQGIDIDVEMAKLDNWLLTHPQHKKTRRRVVNWLNKCERPIPATPAKQQARIEPAKRTACDRCGGDGLISSDRHTYRCPDCRNWEGRFGDVIPFYRTDTKK